LNLTLTLNLTPNLPILNPRSKLCTKLDNRSIRRKDFYKPAWHPAQRTLQVIVKKIFDPTPNSNYESMNSSVMWIEKGYLFGFERDIVLRIPNHNPNPNPNPNPNYKPNSINNPNHNPYFNPNSNSNSVDVDYLILNIEVDGVRSIKEKTVQFNMLRDKYLSSKGVVVERIDASTIRGMSEGELSTWITQKVASLKI
jgi:hypothetical protein